MPVRPKSIVEFELVYWAVIVLGLISAALGWDATMASVQVQASIARFGMAMVYVPIAIGIVIQLLFWFFIARRGSVVAKWFFVVLTGLGMAWSAFSLAAAGASSPLNGVVDVALLILQAVAIMLVFRPDTIAWFGEDTTAA